VGGVEEKSAYRLKKGRCIGKNFSKKKIYTAHVIRAGFLCGRGAGKKKIKTLGGLLRAHAGHGGGANKGPRWICIRGKVKPSSLLSQTSLLHAPEKKIIVGIKTAGFSGRTNAGWGGERERNGAGGGLCGRGEEEKGA